MNRFWIVMWVGLSSASLSFAAVWQDRVFSVDSSGGHEVHFSEFVRDLQPVELIVLGEKHNTPAVQMMQARVISEVTEPRDSSGPFTLGWEFLNYSDQLTTETEFTRFVAGAIDAHEFLKLTQGSDFNSSYIPVLEAAKYWDGQLLGLNLSRKQKAPVVRDGIGALDPSLLPPGFAMGGADYRKRFEDAMGGHAPPDVLDRYFAAQCLTDDVMAYHLTEHSAHSWKFLIAGSFHTDFYDGTVARIRLRHPEMGLKTVKIVDASDWSISELEEKLPTLLVDPNYGVVADYVVFVNEPR